METIQPSKQIASFPISTQNGIGFLEFLDWRLNYSQGGSFATWPATGLSCLHINQVSDLKKRTKNIHISKLLSQVQWALKCLFSAISVFLCGWKWFPDDIVLLQAVRSWKRNHRTRHVVRLQEQHWALLGCCLPNIITNPLRPPLCDNLVNKQSQIIFKMFSSV